MNFEIICIGKLKEKYWKDAVAEYTKRIGGYGQIRITELKETRLRANPSEAEEQEVIREEGKTILEKLRPGTYVVTLEVKGKKKTSEDMARWLHDCQLSGDSDVTFIIGGSLGLSAEVSRKADLKLSFSDMTFPHQMMRVILLEQIYRWIKIDRHEPYHK